MKRNLIVAGAAGGIGSHLVDQLGDEYNVIPTYHTQKSAEAHGGKYYADVADAQDVERMVGTIVQEEGQVAVLVNAAGVSVNGFAHKFAAHAWREVVDINLVGSFNLARAVLPQMRAAKFGRIVFLSSVVFQRPALGTSAYAASKAGLSGLARSIAVENARLGVTGNCIALGYFDAGMLYTIPEDQREAIRASVPMNRFGKLDEILNAVRFLLNTEYVTGQTISVNGGLHMM